MRNISRIQLVSTHKVKLEINLNFVRTMEIVGQWLFQISK